MHEQYVNSVFVLCTINSRDLTVHALGGGKKGLNTQTWVWKCGSKPTLNGVLPFNVYTYIFQLSTTPNHLLGLLSLRQMLKVILAQGFFLGPQLKAHKLNATVNDYYFYTIIWGYSALVLKVMAQKKIWC